MRRHVATFRRRGSVNKSLERYAAATLQMCSDAWERAEGLDTAVRDTVADGLAYLVESAYDSIAFSRDLGAKNDGGAALHAFISGGVSQWFRDRGFAEWYCIGAGSLFRTQRPRILADRSVFRIHRKSGRPRKREAA